MHDQLLLVSGCDMGSVHELVKARFLSLLVVTEKIKTSKHQLKKESNIQINVCLEKI